MLEAGLLCSGERDTLLNGRVALRVSNNGISLREKGLESTHVGVIPIRVNHGVLRAMEVSQFLFQLLVDVLGAADYSSGA